MTMFGHRKCFGRFRTFTGVPGGYRNPPGRILGLMGLSGRRGGRPGQPRPPFPSSPNWTRRRGGALLFPSPPLSLSSFPSPTPTRKGGVLLPVGVGLPPWRALLGRPPLPPCSFIYEGRGAPLDTQVDLLISPSRVRCPPPAYSTSVIS